MYLMISPAVPLFRPYLPLPTLVVGSWDLILPVESPDRPCRPKLVFLPSRYSCQPVTSFWGLPVCQTKLPLFSQLLHFESKKTKSFFFIWESHFMNSTTDIWENVAKSYRVHQVKDRKAVVSYSRETWKIISSLLALCAGVWALFPYNE